MAIETIKVPDIGDASEVEVIELLVSVGQSVAENDSLLVLESDKAAMEIPAPKAGVVKSILLNLGDQVSAGTDMLTLEVESADSPEPEAKTEPETEASPEPEPETGTEPQAPAAAKNDEKAAAPAAAAVSQPIEVPELGTEDEVEVIEVHVKPGDTVAVDDALLTLESDKAAMDVPAPQAGVIESVLVKVGDKVKTGSTIAKIKAEASAPAAETKAPAAESKAPAAEKPTPAAETKAPAAAPPEAAAAPAPTDSSGRVYAGPAVRKLARELGVDLQQVSGTGAKSRILKEDLQGFVKARLQAPATGGGTVAAIPDIDFSQFGEIEQVQRSKLHRLTAINLHRNWSAIPHVAQFNEADVTDLEDFRESLKGEAERRKTKLTFLPFLLKACARTLQEYPQFNVSLHSSGDYLIQKKYIHIGVAVATEAGLVVPVIRNVDQKSIWQLAEEVLQQADKAKQRKLTAEDMSGACFTISSLGAIGGTGFIPIVNAPEVAILGVGKTAIKPVYSNGEFVPRKMLPITLSYDHKAVNGVDGGLFATYLAKLLADIRHLAL